MNTKFYLGLCFAAMASASHAVVLYDAVSSNVKPTEAPWSWAFAGAGGVVTGPGGTGAVSLSTLGSNAFQAGWGQTSPVDLDATLGFGVSWEVQIKQESHATDNQRAGFSTIILGADHKGIEVGYWMDRIFVYNDDATFTPGESFLFDTTVMHKYDLAVVGSAYTLKIDGVTRLTNNTRDYSAFGAPYNVANTLIVGDDTSRGQSSVLWKSYEVVPEPCTVLGLAGLAGLIIKRRRIQS